MGPVLQFIVEMMKSNLKTGASLLLALVVVACGSANGTSNADDGGPTDEGGSSSGGASGGSSSGGSSSSGSSSGGAIDDASVDTDAAAIFTNGGEAGSPEATLPVNLGTAGNYVILSKAGISTMPDSTITGSLGVSPAAASYITGFSLVEDASKVFSTSTQVTGKIYAADYASPTHANLTTAIGDMQTAFTDAAGRAANVTELGAGNIGGMTLTSGVYKWGTGLLIPTDLTLSGSATDVWIFQVAQGLTVDNGIHVSLVGGAVSKNVFWVVAGASSLGTTSQFEGVLLGMTSIALKTGASVDGRLLAQTAVTLEGSTVVEPAL
jgi:hypothetical protein